MNAVSNILLRLIDESGLSTAELSERSGIARYHIHAIRYYGQEIRLDVAGEILRAIGKPWSALGDLGD